MPGTPASGGRNRRSVQQHVIRGTFRPARHGSGELGASGPALRPGVLSDWRPTAAERAELGEQAQALLDATLRLYRLDDVEGKQALLALRSLTMVESMEADVTTWTI